MRKNLFAIGIAVSIILITMLLTGIFLKEEIVTWLSVVLIVLASLAVVVVKIVGLAQDDIKEAEKAENENPDDTEPRKKRFFSNTRKAWEYSTNGEKIKSILFVFTILICSIAFIVLCSYGYMPAGLIVFATGIGLIVISLIAMAVIEKYLIKKHIKDQLQLELKKFQEERLAQAQKENNEQMPQEENLAAGQQEENTALSNEENENKENIENN